MSLMLFKDTSNQRVYGHDHSLEFAQWPDRCLTTSAHDQVLCDVIYAVFSDAESVVQLKEYEDEWKTPLKDELDGVMQL